MDKRFAIFDMDGTLVDSMGYWQCLERETDLPAIVTAVTDAFEVDDREATADIVEFLDKLRSMQLLDE